MQHLDPILVALIRAGMGAAFAAFAVYVTLIGSGLDGQRILAATLGAAVSYIVTRGGIEGILDQKSKPDMNKPPASELDDLDKTNATTKKLGIK